MSLEELRIRLDKTNNVYVVTIKDNGVPSTQAFAATPSGIKNMTGFVKGVITGEFRSRVALSIYTQRKRCNLTVEQMSNQLGFRKQYLSQAESGKMSISLDQYQSIMKQMIEIETALDESDDEDLEFMKD